MGQATVISHVDVTTIELPALGARVHSDGRSPPYQVRHIVQLRTSAGLVGLGEVGPRASREQVTSLGATLVGEDAFSLERIQRRIRSAKFYRMDLAIVAAGFEMACLDIVGKAVGEPVGSLLGGRLRDEIPVIGYLYRRDGGDGNAPVMTNNEMLSWAQKLHHRHGFRTWKLKAGAGSVADDIALIAALRKQFGEHRLRLDPNAAWSLETALAAARHIAPLDLEWLEDPVLGIEAMGIFNTRTAIPTATNMCCIEPTTFPAAVRTHAMDVMLLDLWYLGGPWSARQMAATCQTFGIGVALHSGGGTPEAGVGLAAELHLASALPSLVHAIDTSYFELTDDILTGGRLRCVDGMMQVPTGPGLGIRLDPDSTARAAEQFRRRERDTLRSRYPSYPLF